MQEQFSATRTATTRELRGLALYRERGAEIEPLGKGRYEVPGCSGGTYTVDLGVFGGGEETCNCPDYQRHKQPCKHVYTATVARAKSRAKARRESSTSGRRRGRLAQASPHSRRACEGVRQGDTDGGGVRATLPRLDPPDRRIAHASFANEEHRTIGA